MKGYNKGIIIRFVVVQHYPICMNRILIPPRRNIQSRFRFRFRIGLRTFLFGYPDQCVQGDSFTRTTRTHQRPIKYTRMISPDTTDLRLKI
jgi:hypothetical protein